MFVDEVVRWWRGSPYFKLIRGVFKHRCLCKSEVWVGPLQFRRRLRGIPIMRAGATALQVYRSVFSCPRLLENRITYHAVFCMPHSYPMKETMQCRFGGGIVWPNNTPNTCSLRASIIEHFLSSKETYLPAATLEQNTIRPNLFCTMLGRHSCVSFSEPKIKDETLRINKKTSNAPDNSMLYWLSMFSQIHQCWWIQYRHTSQ